MVSWDDGDIARTEAPHTTRGQEQIEGRPVRGPLPNQPMNRYDPGTWGRSMRRREFFVSVGGLLLAGRLSALAQSAGKLPHIGFLGTSSAAGIAARLEGFRQGLRDLGYVEGSTITIDYRWLEGHYDRLPELAADLV